MAVSEAEIEALALGVMRAWVAGDAKAAKKLLARDFMLMAGTLPPQLLDRPSLLAAIQRGFTCHAFALRQVLVRRHGKVAWLVAGADLAFDLECRAWAGPFLISQLWRCGPLGGWKLAEMSLARLDEGERRADALRALQLWT